MKKIRILFILVLVGLILPVSVVAKPLGNAGNKDNTQKPRATCTIKISGATLTAQVYGDKQLDITCKGQIKNSKACNNKVNHDGITYKDFLTSDGKKAQCPDTNYYAELKISSSKKTYNVTLSKKKPTEKKHTSVFEVNFKKEFSNEIMLEN